MAILSGCVSIAIAFDIATHGKTMHVRFDDTQGHVQEQNGRKVE
jgi:hypothetical protein